MKKFIRLLEHELKLAAPFQIILMVAVLLGQLVNYVLQVRQMQSGSELLSVPHLSLFFDDSILYPFIIGAAAIAVLAYSLLSWVREWGANGNFIYRLATLPGSRLPIGLAKFTTTFFMIFSLLLLQIAIFELVNWLAVSNHLIHESIRWYEYLWTDAGHLMSGFIIPSDLPNFLITYSIGGGVLLTLFNLVIIFLTERVNNLVKASLMTIGYGLISYLAGWGLDQLINRVLQLSMYEWWLITIFVWLFALAQVAVMKYLLDRRMNV